MKFILSRNELAEAVTHAVHGVPNNPVNPVNSGMLIYPEGGCATFSGSDGSVTFTGKTGKHLPEQVIIPGKLFADVVRTLPPYDVELSTEERVLTLKCNRIQFKFPIITGEYPTLPEPSDFVGELEAEEFADTIKKVVSSCSQIDTTPALSAVRFEPGDRLLVAATDRYRLAAVRCGWKPWPRVEAPPGGCLVPAGAVEKFARTATGTVKLGWAEGVVSMQSESVEAEDLSVTSRVISGEWPKGWRNLLDSPPCPVEVSTGDLLAALKRASLASEGDSPVELTFTTGRLVVECGEGNHAQDILDVSYTGDEFKVLFGIKYLTDGLAGCGPVACFGWTEPHRPVWIVSGAYSYTILPRRRL